MSDGSIPQNPNQGADVANAIVALGTEGLQWMNAVTNNRYPTTSIVTTPGGPAVVSGGIFNTTLITVALLVVGLFVLLYLLRG